VCRESNIAVHQGLQKYSCKYNVWGLRDRNVLEFRGGRVDFARESQEGPPSGVIGDLKERGVQLYFDVSLKGKLAPKVFYPQPPADSTKV